MSIPFLIVVPKVLMDVSGLCLFAYLIVKTIYSIIWHSAYYDLKVQICDNKKSVLWRRAIVFAFPYRRAQSVNGCEYYIF